MKIINNSKNTVYVEDIDLTIPYQDGKPETIDADTLKKSRCLRNLLVTGFLDIAEHNENERIEASIVYMKKKQNSSPAKKDEKEILPEKIETTKEPVEIEKCSDEIEVRLHGIFYDASGYGKVNRHLAMGLDQAGIKVKVDAKRTKNQLNEEELKPIVKLANTQISKRHITIDSVIPSFAEISTGAYKVLYSTIESYSVPKQFADSCEMYDEIWLTSPWSKSVLEKHTNKPIYVVPTGADPKLYCEDGPMFDYSPTINRFVFVSVFGWNYRKGYDVLLKAYFDEFDANDDVSLLIVSRYQSGQNKHNRMKIKNDIDEIMQQFPNKDLPHVVRYSKITPEKDMPKIYRAADCFVLPTRGEGGGLPPLEASLCGLPVIMTNASGQQMYLREDNSYMLPMDRLEEIQTGQMKIHYWDGQLFPSLKSKETHNNLRRLMREVVNNYPEAKKRNKRLQNLIMNKFTWNNTTNAAVKRLKEIHRKLRGK